MHLHSHWPPLEPLPLVPHQGLTPPLAVYVISILVSLLRYLLPCNNQVHQSTNLGIICYLMQLMGRLNQIPQLHVYKEVKVKGTPPRYSRITLELNLVALVGWILILTPLEIRTTLEIEWGDPVEAVVVVVEEVMEHSTVMVDVEK